MKPLKLKQIRTYQSVKFGPKEYTTFLSGDKRTDSIYFDLEMWLIGDRVFLRHKEKKLEKIIFTSNISDIQTVEIGIMDLALEEAEVEENSILQVEVIEDNTYQGVGDTE